MTSTVTDALPPDEMAQLRQALYRFLAMLFLYPSRERLGELQRAATDLIEADAAWRPLPFRSRLQGVLTSLAGLNGQAAENLEGEYIRILRVRPCAPPYESFYLNPEGQWRGVIASQLESEYAGAGLVLGSSLQDMPDHLSVELEFMSFLCAAEVKARRTLDQAATVQSRFKQRYFLHEHLSRWFPRFARRVVETAPDSLYGVIAAACYAYLRFDLDYLGLAKLAPTEAQLHAGP